MLWACLLGRPSKPGPLHESHSCLRACHLDACSHAAEAAPRAFSLGFTAGGLRALSAERAQHAAQAVISGVVYGLGDFTAQTYEQRSFGDFDFARTLRSALCGLLAHGPLSHLFYEKLDRFFILSPVRTGLC